MVIRRQMFVYNITLNMEPAIEMEAKLWMEQIFIPMIMKNGVFHEFQICKLQFVDQVSPAYAIQFYAAHEPDKNFLHSELQTKYLDIVFEQWGLQVMPFATMMDIIKPAYLSFLHQN
jgi:hypothetical protein